jgi:inosine-uridine nucleoside N-ribohydrolase
MSTINTTVNAHASNTISNVNLLIDMDPGTDDLLTLIWLSKYVKENKINLIGISIVAGNTDAFNAFKNCFCMLKILDIKNVIICKPFNHIKPINDNAFDFHGNDGAFGFNKLDMFSSNDFQQEMIEAYNKAPIVTDVYIDIVNKNIYDVTLISTGPLTNISDLINIDKHFGNKLKQYIMMGGAFNVPGNMSSYAEFNIWYDPVSANNVFANINNIIVMPLDVTNSLQVNAEYINNILEKNKQKAKNFHCYYKLQLITCIKHISNSLTNASIEYRDVDVNGYKLHDPSTIMYLLHPELFEFKNTFVHVDVNSKSSHNYGKTCIDQRNKKDNVIIPTTKYATNVDAKKGLFLFFCDINDIVCC